MTRTFAVFGDSISTFEGVTAPGNAVFYQGQACLNTGVESVEDTWWMRVIRHFEGTLLSNASYSGSMTAGAGFPAGWSPERIVQIAGPNGESPDDILVFMGTNDFGWGSTRAQAGARGGATPPCVNLERVPEAVAGSACQQDLDDFERAYAAMLDAMRQAYPNARIWCLTLPTGRERGRAKPCFTYQLRGLPLGCYNACIARQALDRGCNLVDLSAAGFDYDAADGTHPTKRGMRQLAAIVVSQMEGQPLDGLAGSLPELFSEKMRAERWCEKPSCVGCEHARNTGNQWSCVCELDRD